MDRIDELADLVRPRDGLRVIGGRVVQVIDSTHVLIDLGDKAVTAFRPASLAVACQDGADVRVLVGGGVAEVVSGSGTTAAPLAVAAGTKSLTITSSDRGTASVTFPAGRFTAAPLVVATLATSGQGVILSATSVSASGCTLNGITGNGGTVTLTVSVSWLAVQMT